MKDAWKTVELGLVVAAALALGAIAAVLHVRYKDAQPKPVPTLIPTASSSARPIPSPKKSAVPPPPPAPAFVDVTDLRSVIGWWGEGEGEEAPAGPWARLSNREDDVDAGIRWSIPYPWHLVVRMKGHLAPFDCGLFEKQHKEATHPWPRIGYCKGGSFDGKVRRATKVYLERKTKGTTLRVRISKYSFTFDRKGTP